MAGEKNVHQIYSGVRKPPSHILPRSGALPPLRRTAMMPSEPDPRHQATRSLSTR